MKTIPCFSPMAIWAARDLMRHPGRALLLFACLASLVFLMATALLFGRALDATYAGLLDQAPDLVVRRIDAGGWAPLPMRAAVYSAAKVPGVLDPTPRLWGVVAGPAGPLTVVASTALIPERLRAKYAAPPPGKTVVGQGVGAVGDRLRLGGRDPLELEVIDTFPASTGLATHDLVWTSPADARRLLGLAPDQASDLAIHLFHRQEAQAIQADLAAAFPWPVRITDRHSSKLRHHTRALRTGGIALVAAIPALLALLLIIGGTAMGNAGQQARWRLYQSLGWTSADIVRLQVLKALIVGVPAVVLGLSAAYAAVFYPLAAGITAFWITGGRYLPALHLTGNGALVTMLEIAAMVGLPYLATVFLTTLRGVAGDARPLFEAHPWN